MRRRWLIWGINHAPEATGIGPFTTGMARYLASRGDEVHVLTTFPYYPEWRKRPGDEGRLYRTDILDGVEVHRCWHHVPARPGAVQRMLHEASFVATSLPRALVLPKWDGVVVVSPPLLLGAAAAVAGVFRPAPFVFHVQDLQPAAAVGLGLLKAGILVTLLEALEGVALRCAAAVSGITVDMVRHFRSLGVPAQRAWLFPNWIPAGDSAEVPPGEVAALRAAFGVPEGALLATYSGNLGLKQGLEVVLAAAARLRELDPEGRVRLVLVGDGVEAAALRDRAAALGAGARLQFRPLLDGPGYRALLAATDVGLVTQRKGTGRYFFPSKLLSLLAAGVPVVAAADPGGSLDAAVSESRAGWCVGPGDADALASRLVDLARGGRGSLAAAGAAGKAWVAQFTETEVLAGFARRLESVVRGEASVDVV